MPSAPPDGDPPRPTGRCLRRPRGVGSARSGSTCTCRSARCAAATATSTPTPPTSSATRRAPPGRRTPRRRSPRSGWPARCSATSTSPVDTVFFGGGTPTLLPPADLVACSTAIDDEFGLAPGAEVTTEANPDSVTPADLASFATAGFNRISFGMQSAVPHVLARPRPHARPGAGAARRSAGRARPGSSRSASTSSTARRGSRRRLAGQLEQRARAAARTTSVGVRADRRGGHGAGPAGRRGELPDAGRRRPRRQVPARRRGAGARPGFGGTRCRTGPATTAARCRHNLALLARRRLVGRRPGRALARRRRAVVERQAPGRVRRPHRVGRPARPAAGGARRRDPPGGAGAARDPAGRRVPVDLLDQPARDALRAWSSAGSSILPR